MLLQILKVLCVLIRYFCKILSLAHYNYFVGESCLKNLSSVNVFFNNAHVVEANSIRRYITQHGTTGFVIKCSPYIIIGDRCHFC